MSALDRFAVIDVETTGLSYTEDRLLEVGVVIADLNLKPIDTFNVMVWDGMTATRERFMRESVAASAAKGESSQYEFVVNMHDENGVWERCKKEGVEYAQADIALSKFLTHHGFDGTDPMCGSSVTFDKRFMERFMERSTKLYHYRIIDVSSMRGIAERYPRPGVMESWPKGRKLHTTVADCEDTLEELAYMMKYWVGIDTAQPKAN